MFKVGDKAVYPTQGVGIIEAIEAREFAGENHDFYIINIVDGDMKVMVPVATASQAGLRSLIAKDRVKAIYDILEDKSGKGGAVASWSRRQREYNDKIKSGDLYEVAEVLRELYQIREEKELSYGEKKVLEHARKLLVTEISLSIGAEEDAVIERVEKIFVN